MERLAERRRQGRDQTVRGQLSRLIRLVSFPGSPGWLFHLVLAVVASLWIHSASTPAGVSIGLWLVSTVVFSTAAVVWGVWLFRWAVGRGRGGSTGPAWRFLVAPVCGTVFVSALVLDAPLRTRWSLAREPFDHLVDTAPPPVEPDQPVTFEVPDVVGTYRVDQAVRVGDAVFVYVASGSPSTGFLLDAGFAHLPDGRVPSPDPVDRGFGKVTYRHVDGDWYAWAAHW